MENGRELKIVKCVKFCGIDAAVGQGRKLREAKLNLRQKLPKRE